MLFYLSIFKALIYLSIISQGISNCPRERETHFYEDDERTEPNNRSILIQNDGNILNVGIMANTGAMTGSGNISEYLAGSGGSMTFKMKPS